MEDLFVAVLKGKPFLKSVADSKAVAWYAVLKEKYGIVPTSPPTLVLEVIDQAEGDGWEVLRAAIIPETSPLAALGAQADKLKLSAEAVANEAESLV